MRSRSDVLTGLVVGGFLALAYLVAGPLTLIPGLAVWAWLVVRHRSLPALAASLVGFGAVWVLLMGQVSWACANDPTCVLPEFAVVWIGIGVVVMGVGIVPWLATRSRLQHG